MRVYPVLDLMGGLVVRGVGGERDRYRPIDSALSRSPEPLAVARAFRDRYGLDRLYVADLDAIGGSDASTSIYTALVEDGFSLLVDAGIRSPEAAASLRAAVSVDVIAALETLPSPAVLAATVDRIGVDGVIFSLDLVHGQHLGAPGAWPIDVDLVAREARSAGVRRLILLDLASVGRGRGPRHLERVRRWKDELDGVEIITGGGVRGRDDLVALRESGADGVLIATALHDEAWCADDLRI